MKNTIIMILSILLWNYSAMAQTDCGQDTIMYSMAYNYIINDSVNQNKKIEVSDSIVDLDRFWFSQYMNNFPIEKEKLDQYRANKNYKWFESYYSPCIASLFCKKNQQSNNILFFSQIEDNMLRVDILPKKPQNNKISYNDLAFQNTGQIYLFLFTFCGHIRAVFGTKIIYD